MLFKIECRRACSPPIPILVHGLPLKEMRIIAATGVLYKAEIVMIEDPHFKRIKEVKAKALGGKNLKLMRSKTPRNLL